MCDEPMGVTGGLALGSLLGAFKREDSTTKAAPAAAAPVREVRVSGRVVACVAAPVLSFALWEVLGWWRCLVVAATVTVFAWAALAVMYRLHRYVIADASPAMRAALARRGIPVAGRYALPRAMVKRLEQPWRVVSVEKVPDSPRALQGRVLAEGETMRG